MKAPRRPASIDVTEPARTPEEAAERLRAAGYRVSHRAPRKRRVLVAVPSLLPYLFEDHGPQSEPGQ